MALEPKNDHSDIHPVIAEIQHVVTRSLLKRGVNYCLQVSARYNVGLIILIIYIDKLNQDARTGRTLPYYL